MLNRKILLPAVLGVSVVMAITYLTLTKTKSKTPVDKAFSAYVSAFTSGTISREANIRVRLNSGVAKEHEINSVTAKKLFEFSPPVKGNTVWIDSRTVEFRPSEKMKPGQSYKAIFFLSEVMKVPAKFSEFNFGFEVINQSYEVKPEGLRSLNNKNFEWQTLTGTLNTADEADGDKVEKILNASQNGKSLLIHWNHHSDRMTHGFIVDSILRGQDSSSVVLSWNGKPIEVDLKGEQNFTVPALGDFILSDADVTQDESEQYLLLRFSDPLLDKQNLQGLITIDNMSDLRFTIEDNTIRVYPPSKQTGTLNLYVDAAIKNALGKRLKGAVRKSVLFEEIKPSVRLVGKGMILPSSNGLLFPFEAVNLNAVDVRVVKVYENNIAQFLQVNNLAGENELTRVGRIVLKKTVPLSSLKKTNLTKWNQFALDLGDLIKVDPGAIYRVSISFRKKYSLYKCTEPDSTATDENTGAQEINEDDWDQKDASSWDFVDNNYDEEGNYNYGYRWSNRDNPCKKEYYSANRWAARNVLASDLGLLAKRGMEGSMLFTVTDLKTTEPLSGVTLEVYNFQNQLIHKTETNGDGMVEVSLTQKPFLLVAKKGQQRGYLKLDDASSLSLSMFDITGEKVQKGIKGFIYGERGVWRPGDSLYLMFILEDKQKSLPESYPVTFEFYDPRGQLTKKMVQSESLNGFYSFLTATDDEAPTGSWEARVKVGNATFTKTIRVETVMPNRLKIKFDFAKKYLAKNEKQSAKMEVHWLTGVTARNLKANVEVSLTTSKTTFPKYSEFIFDDPTRKFSADKQVLFDKEIDANGNARVDADIKVSDAAPGVLQANFVTKVFEPGGSFSIDRFSVPYHAYDVYTGLRVPKGDKARGMLLTDTNHTVQIVSVDRNGAPVTSKRKILVEFYKINWRWWWDKSEENLTNFTSTSYNHREQWDTVSTVNGEGTWTLRLNYPNWGRYLIRMTDLESGHSTGKVFYMDWPGWAGRAQKDGAGAATMLTFTSDKDKYTVGEDAVLTIPSGKGSRALISVENGTKVLKSYWMEDKEGSTQFKIPVTPDMTPNVYVSVTMLQPHSQTVNDLPIRMYGIIPMQVEDVTTHLKPVIKMPDVLKPEEPVNITVKEEQGKPMTYTVAVVDEGLLDLTRFQTPDPWANFYAREALGVKTWDMFEFVVGAWGAQLERILGIGGDEGINKPKEGSKANRFKPVVKFLGPYHLGKGESKTVSFIMPQYVGSVRTMVIAGEDRAYGFAEKATPVRKPLMVLGTLPRVLGPGETVDLPVTVFALEKNVKDVKVEIVANDMFFADGEKSHTIKFSEPGDDVVNFKLKVKDLIGIGKVKIVVSSGKERAETSIELDVRNPNPRMVNVIDTVLVTGQSWNPTYKAVGMAGTNKTIMEISSVPPLNLGARLNYLIHYPYGCVEQTTSSVFPQLYLTSLMDMPSDKKNEIEHNIRAGIQRLKLFQLPSGGMSYWPGDHEENEWGSNYAGHFLVEAEQKGYSLPAGFLEQWKKYQRNKATTWSSNNGESVTTQAYRLYTLALAKSPELGSMNRLKESKYLTTTSQWLLAAAYQLSGQPEVANQLIANLSMEVKDYKELSGTFGSDERDESIILETLSLMDKKEKATPLVKKLSAALCTKEWMSTQTTAYTLLAIAKYVGRSGLNTGMNFTYQFNSATMQSAVSNAAVKQVEMKMKGTEPGTASIKNNGKGILYARIITEGIPKTGDETSAQNGLEIKVAYKQTEGGDVDVAKMKQGTDFYAEVTVTNPGLKGNYAEMALTQIFPSGWEILNTRLDGTDNSSKTSTPKYQDIRDDRVYTFFDLKARETKTFRIYLNSSYLGNFYLPAVTAEAMYDASISVHLAGKWVNVSTEGKGRETSSVK